MTPTPKATRAHAASTAPARIPALFCFACWLFGAFLCGSSCAQSEVSAQDATPGAVQLVYRAPASCPPRATFEARLAQRLRGATRTAGAPVVLTVSLRERGPAGPDGRQVAAKGDFLGTISLSDGEGVLGPRAIEAGSCSQAVDALTFVAALLVDDRARRAADLAERTRSSRAPATTPRARATTSARTAPDPARSQAAASVAPAGTPPSEAPTAPQTTSASGTADTVEAPTSTSERPAPTDDRVATPTTTRKAEPARTPRADEARGPRDAEAADVSPTRPLRGAVAIAALLASGVAPQVRPGLGLSVGLAKPLVGAFALSLAVGVRATWPADVRSPEGDGQFFWWSSSAALCGWVRSARDAARFSLCLDAEAGQILARGRDTDAPRSRGATWLALGPAARASVRVRRRWRLVPGLGLLAPAARDRFVVGASELHRVARLTFRAELAAAVEWP